jgi:hypothetical protein
MVLRHGRVLDWLWNPGLSLVRVRLPVGSLNGNDAQGVAECLEDVLRSNHFMSIGSEVVLAGAQQPPGTFSYTVCR